MRRLLLVLAACTWNAIGSAQWLRDTTNQVSQYGSILAADNNLAALVKAVIQTEARWITEYPYCGAFQPPPESGFGLTRNPWAEGVTVNPPVDKRVVFECKYELDSLAAFLKLSRIYHNATKDFSFLNDSWLSAMSAILKVVDEQSQPTFDPNYNIVSYYNWTGGSGSPSPMVPNGGNGEPKGRTGMVGTSHRPSDDLVVFAYNIPANAMLSVELRHSADLLRSVDVLSDMAEDAERRARDIKQAITQHGVVDSMLTYETNGYGGAYFMDDANVPSLLSLPYLGFMDRHDPLYVRTRAAVLSARNPYYSRGVAFYGVGGPHVSPVDPWPMSLISAIYGTDDDQEILQHLYTVVNSTAGLGLMHESVNIHEPKRYSRSWFAWANSYFSEMILDLAERKPHLILNSSSFADARGTVLGNGWMAAQQKKASETAAASDSSADLKPVAHGKPTKPVTKAGPGLPLKIGITVLSLVMIAITYRPFELFGLVKRVYDPSNSATGPAAVPSQPLDFSVHYKTPITEDTARKAAIVNAFKHAWRGYERDAWGYDNYHPISHKGSNLGDAEQGIGYMIVDVMDTLMIMADGAGGRDEELNEMRRRAAEWMETSLDFDNGGEVNTFEVRVNKLVVHGQAPDVDQDDH
ncbi:hypothetical protein FRB97_001910 [Tulasnella sp. 331]|nr:hypothetical protein FRB97_001910 [Tulasnella sp. 331]